MALARLSYRCRTDGKLDQAWYRWALYLLAVRACFSMDVLPELQCVSMLLAVGSAAGARELALYSLTCCVMAICPSCGSGLLSTSCIFLIDRMLTGWLSSFRSGSLSTYKVTSCFWLLVLLLRGILQF
ncbi:hypothetical protein COO60DRAFT_937476 [Scenedesmus sp. NREL 46B-D3]|nr:hypothetical protein COO60DRAFT_937476 [Scenedesmus sp. NREL 46B-D3]